MPRPSSLPFALALALATGGLASGQGTTSVGLGGYLDEPPPGAIRPQAEVSRTDRVRGPMPTNDWWSSLAWLPFSERMYAHPLAFRAEKGGMRVYAPGRRIAIGRSAIMGGMPDNADDLILGHSSQPDFDDARVDGFGDWFVTARFGPPGRGMAVTFGHGSPFAFARFEGGTPRLSLPEVPVVWAGDARSPVLGLTVRGQAYACFGPTGSTWDGLGTRTLTLRTDRDYFSIALLPEASEFWLGQFRDRAYNHVVDSRVEWAYEAGNSVVTTRFRVSVDSKEGRGRETLLALYPHQYRYEYGGKGRVHLRDPRVWKPEYAAFPAPELPDYASVRGGMILVSGEGFATTHAVSGLLPCVPATEGADRSRMKALIDAEVDAPEPPPKDTYWEGKWLGRMATLIPIAEAYGFEPAAKALTNRVRRRLEAWLAAKRPDGKPKAATVFAYEPRWGTVIGYPASYGSDAELNDHHFHYGYFIKAAAEVARRDPSWAADDRWGGMVRLLIRDIASPRHDDPLFPFLRNFDPYAGHSWASGHARFGDGNNNESSSEAMNAWAGIAFWGAATGDIPTRDLGLYLYATDLHAIEEYWFDTQGRNRPKDYRPSVATMIWGGKSVNETWFTANPEMVHGINWLPITGASLYLGRDRKYVRKNYEALVAENGGTNWDAWPDLVAMYRALDDPADALKQFEAIRDPSKFEPGNSPANAYHWIINLGFLGRVESLVTADEPFAATFHRDPTVRPGSLPRTHVVYSVDDGPRAVRFTDGNRVVVDRKGLNVGPTLPEGGGR